MRLYRILLGVLALTAGVILHGQGDLQAKEDCNGNGFEDSTDITPSNFDFLPRAGFHGVDQAFSVAAADLDGDGHLDVATAQKGMNTVTVQMNHGEEGFDPGVSYGSVGEGPDFVTAADFDGDSDIDLVTANSGSGDISLLFNQGDGTLGGALIYALYGQPGALTAADFDRDGDMDLAFLEYVPCAPGTVSVLLNEGKGTFTWAGEYYVGGSPLSFASADMDGDGNLDLVTANYGCYDCETVALGSISVLPNLGDGTFGDARSYASPEWPDALTTADLDGDVDVDVAVTLQELNQVWTLTNLGDGRLLAGGSYSVGEAPTAVTSADLDGDSDMDLISANRLSDDVSVLLNDGDGKFEAARTYAVIGYPLSVAAGDFDGNQFQDMVVVGLGGNADVAGEVAILMNQTIPPVSLDQNRNGLPDECEVRFHRGDSNNDGEVNISDVIAALDFLFLGGTPPACMDSADSNDDGSINLSDGISLLRFLFLGGQAPAYPGPTSAPCGLDPGAAGSSASLGCASYDYCGL